MDNENGFHHTLGQGEDIFLLAELYYGDASLWWIIYHANLDEFADDPETSLPGTEIFIPYLEIREEPGKVPTSLDAKGISPSFDPMILLADQRYGDPTLCFDLYSYNRWDSDRVIQAGERILYLARASKPDMRRAERWRSMFYRE